MLTQELLVQKKNWKKAFRCSLLKTTVTKPVKTLFCRKMVFEHFFLKNRYHFDATSLRKKIFILTNNLSNSDIQKIGLGLLNAQNLSKKVLIHYNISLYLLTPKFHIKPLAFYFPFQFRTSFSPKSLQAISWAQHLFSDPCKWWRLYNGLSYFQSDRSRLANSTTLFLQLPVL